MAHVLIQILYIMYVFGTCSTPSQSKSGSACHMTRSANHRRHSAVIYIRGRITDVGQIFHPLEVLCRGSKTQLQVGKHLNFKGDLSPLI